MRPLLLLLTSWSAASLSTSSSVFVGVPSKVSRSDGVCGAGASVSSLLVPKPKKASMALVSYWGQPLATTTWSRAAGL